MDEDHIRAIQKDQWIAELNIGNVQIDRHRSLWNIQDHKRPRKLKTKNIGRLSMTRLTRKPFLLVEPY